MLIKFLKENKIILFFRILREELYYALRSTRYIANGERKNCEEKFRTDLLIRTHAIEKGLSISPMKLGFGEEKIVHLLKDLASYYDSFKNDDFVSFSLSVIKRYVDIQKECGFSSEGINEKFDSLLHRINYVDKTGLVGVLNFRKSDLDEKLRLPFDEFSQIRYSVRDFGTAPVDRESVRKALQLCERTPSACNRQPWRVYVVYDQKKKSQLFDYQGGCRGFSDKMQAAILLACDEQRYNINELRQLYVDGGLYAMNLLYALNFYGIASIPLTMGHKVCKLKNFYPILNVGKNEVPVLLIGIGSYKEEYKVAVSHRNNYSDYYTEI